MFNLIYVLNIFIPNLIHYRVYGVYMDFSGTQNWLSYSLVTPRSEESTKIKFKLITSIALEGNLIKCNNCTRSNNFTAEVNQQESAGIEIVIAESHILPFSVKQVDAFTKLHEDFDMQQNFDAGRLYDQNPKKNTKFNYSCAELYYERYHKEQDKNNQLDNSKVRAPAS